MREEGHVPVELLVGGGEGKGRVFDLVETHGDGMAVVLGVEGDVFAIRRPAGWREGSVLCRGVDSMRELTHRSRRCWLL